MGATYILSVAIVVVVAIVFRQADPPATTPKPDGKTRIETAATPPATGNHVRRVSRIQPRKGFDPPRPREAFTIVEAGESLVDVAVRVYGTERSVSELWRVNRDLLATPDHPILEGMSLRTP